MQYRQLERTDLKVSQICLGTMTWAEQNTQEEAFEQMDAALDYGVNFFDTAELYPVPPMPLPMEELKQSSVTGSLSGDKEIK